MRALLAVPSHRHAHRIVGRHAGEAGAALASRGPRLLVMSAREIDHQAGQAGSRNDRLARKWPSQRWTTWEMRPIKGDPPRSRPELVYHAGRRSVNDGAHNGPAASRRACGPAWVGPVRATEPRPRGR